MADGANPPPGRLPGAVLGAPVPFSFDGRPLEARAGDTVAAALWALGIRELRRSTARGEPRAPYCCMGICYECLVRVDGREVRACTTVVRPGMVVESGGRPGGVA